MWTDDMPLQGKCPEQDCGWRYDIRKELKRNVGRKAAASGETSPRCPRCGRGVGQGWSSCEDCGILIFGSRSIPKRHLVALLILVLAVLSLLVKYLF